MPQRLLSLLAASVKKEEDVGVPASLETVIAIAQTVPRKLVFRNFEQIKPFITCPSYVLAPGLVRR